MMHSTCLTQGQEAAKQATILVVEDDQDVRHSLGWLLRSVDYQVQEFAQPQDVLDTCTPDLNGCIVVDLCLPGMSGLELRRRLLAAGCLQPFIVVSGNGAVPVVVEAMQMGAVDFIEKPFNRHRLLDCVHRAVERDVAERRRRDERRQVVGLLDTLTDREREVLTLVAQGRLTKEIARQLRISTKTVDVYRSNVSKKMHVSSVSQLVHLLTKFSLLQ